MNSYLLKPNVVEVERFLELLGQDWSAFTARIANDILLLHELACGCSTIYGFHLIKFTSVRS